MGQLDGKVAIVTGSGRGIGQQVALRLARDGAAVVVNDLDDAPAKETIALIEKAGGRAVACNGDVTAKDFGERMVKDHQKANEELKTIASSKGATIPTNLTRTEKSTMEKLQKANGAEFDREYAAAMVKDHRTDVKDFKDAADDLKDPELKAFAQKTLPTLQEHLRMAEDMERNVRSVSPTGR